MRRWTDFLPLPGRSHQQIRAHTHTGGRVFTLANALPYIDVVRYVCDGGGHIFREGGEGAIMIIKLINSMCRNLFGILLLLHADGFFAFRSDGK